VIAEDMENKNISIKLFRASTYTFCFLPRQGLGKE